MHACVCEYFYFFFFNDTATTEIYTLSLHDALPISGMMTQEVTDYIRDLGVTTVEFLPIHAFVDDSYLVEKGLRNYWGYRSEEHTSELQSANISYAVFCLKKKKPHHSIVRVYSV